MYLIGGHTKNGHEYHLSNKQRLLTDSQSTAAQGGRALTIRYATSQASMKKNDYGTNLRSSRILDLQTNSGQTVKLYS